MTLAVDADDMGAIRKRLETAVADLAGARTEFPGGEAFGPPVLGRAVAAFAAMTQREIEAISTRWEALGAGVGDALDDFAGVEDDIVSRLQQVGGGLLAAIPGAEAARTSGPAA